MFSPPAKAYQIPNPGVNAAGRAVREFSALALACALLVTSPGGAAAGPVTYPASDGVPITADLYRPASPSSRGVVLLAGMNGSRADWKPLASALADRGFYVLAPDLPGQGESGSETPGAAPFVEEDSSDWWTEAIRASRYLRTVTGDSITALFWCGAGEGAAAAVIGASRDTLTSAPAAAFVLFSPDSLLGDVSIRPLLARSGTPFLIIAGREELNSADAARDLYLRTGSGGVYWETEGDARGTGLLAMHPGLAAEVASWMAGVSPARPPRGVTAGGTGISLVPPRAAAGRTEISPAGSPGAAAAGPAVPDSHGPTVP